MNKELPKIYIFVVVLFGTAAITCLFGSVSRVNAQNLETPQPIVKKPVRDEIAINPCDLEDVLCPEGDPFFADVTAYSLSGTMANGELVHYGAMACPDSVALGTIYLIDGMGTRVCTDRTASGSDDLFDVWMGSYSAAIAHGAQKKQLTKLQ